MKYFAVIKGEEVDGIAIADDPLDADGMWIDVTDMVPMPQARWSYKDGAFIAPPDPVIVDPPAPPPPPKTEEQKIADATAAAIAKLIADGVLKQA
jgi:hypothetical protein